jgi:hypothetical protein
MGKNKTIISWNKIYLLLVASIIFSISISSSTYASKKTSSNLSIQVVNTFIANTYFTDTSDFYITWSNIYTSWSIVDVSFSADKTTSYSTQSWDIVWIYSGSWIDTYIQTHIITLPLWDGIKTIPSQYIALDDEFYTATDLQIIVDTTPPLIALPLSPNLWQTINTNSILFRWKPSTDELSGVKEYTIELSQEPSFSSPITYTSTDTSLQINNNLLPNWTIYRRVKATDFVWNTSVWPSIFFTKQEIVDTSNRWWTAPEEPIFDVDNISLRWYTSNIAYVCEGDIRWYVYSNTNLRDIDLQIEFIWEDKTYSYSPTINSIWYYAIPIDYINSESQMHLPWWIYAIQVKATHPAAWTKLYTYNNFIVTDKCSEEQEELIPTPPVLEHWVWETYIKNTFDIQRIKDQNTYIKILQNKEKNTEKNVINEDPLSALLQYPDLLQKTWADPRIVLGHLSLLYKFSPDASSKLYLWELIQILQPGWYIWILLLMYLCYDIELYKKWLHTFYVYTRKYKKSHKKLA